MKPCPYRTDGEHEAYPDKVHKVWRCRACGEVVAKFLSEQERQEIKAQMEGGAYGMPAGIVSIAGEKP